MRLPDDIRVWVAGGTAACALILGAGYVTVVAPQLSGAHNTQTETSDAQTANTALTAQLTALGKQNRNLATYVTALRTARTELPITGELSDLTAQLAGDSRGAHVNLSSLAIGAITAVTAAGADATAAGTAASTTTGAAGSDTSGAAASPAPATTTSDTTTGSSTTTGSTTTGSTTTGSTTTGSTTTGSTTTGSTTGAGGVVAAGAGGPAGQVFQIQVTTITHGSLAQQLMFLHAVQRPGTRVALVTSANLAPDAATTGGPATPTSPASTKTAVKGPTRMAAAAVSMSTSSTLTTLLDIFVTPQTPAATAELAKQLATRAAR